MASPESAVAFEPVDATPVQSPTSAGFVPVSDAPVQGLPATAAGPAFQPASSDPVDPRSFAALRNQSPRSFVAQIGAQAQRALRAGAQHENALMKNWDYARSHAGEDVFAILGASQRAVGAAVGSNERGENLTRALARIGHDVFHPGDLDAHGQDATARDTEAIRALTHGPTHQQIDAWVTAHVSKDLQPYAAGILKGSEDIALQALSDPLTYAGGAGLIERLAHFAKVGVRGAQQARVLHTLADSQGAQAHFPWLGQLAKAYDRIGDAAGTVFKARPELDKILDQRGRAFRLQIESKHITDAAKARPLDEAAVHDNAATTARVQQYLQRMNAAPQSAQRILQHVLAGTPAERARDLAKMREKLRAKFTADETATFLQQHGGYAQGTPPMSADAWSTFERDTAQYRDIAQGHPVFQAIKTLTGVPRALQQASLFLNPLPHGIKNVGELAYLAGGVRVVPRAVKAMVGGVPPAVQHRLEQIGADPGYTRELQPTIWSHLIPGWHATSGALQESMGRMEQSWRHALLEELDRKLGPSRNAADELMKGHIVNDRLGDYRNQSAFVQLFQMMGGPWVAFRLGIVPKNVLRAVMEHPERVLQVARAQEDLQRNRTRQGQRANRLELGGPVADAAKAATDLPGYLSSPASGGVIAQLEQFYGRALGKDRYEPVGKAAGDLAEQYNPFGELYDPMTGEGAIGNLVTGHGKPAPNAPHGGHVYQSQTLTDRLITSMLETLAVYFQKQESRSQKTYEKRTDKRVEKQGL